MDKRFEQALEYSNFRMILNTRQENLKTLMNNKLTFSYGGGLFKINIELLSFLAIIVMGGGKNLILIDENDTPIMIEDPEDFAEKATKQYEKVLSQYYNSYQKLSEAREIRKVIDWDEENKEKEE